MIAVAGRACTANPQVRLRSYVDEFVRATYKRGPTRVLVVDDEPNITELVSIGLRYEGFDVSSAHDGRGALRAVRELSRSW